MLPTRKAVKEELASIGYKPHPHFYSQPHGWFEIYERPSSGTLRLHYVNLPEARVGPFYSLGFISDNGFFTMSTIGPRTLTIKDAQDLEALQGFVDEYHRLFALCDPFSYRDSPYEIEDALRIWENLKASWLKYGKIGSVREWKEWRKTVARD